MRYGSDEERAARSMQFTKGEVGYFFYNDAWSKGIAVSQYEYETYIDGGSSEFFEAIAGREATEPRRPYWQTLRRTCNLLPKGVWVVYIVIGVMSANWAVNSVSTVNATLSGALALFFSASG
jgi:hypothetical protein